LTQRAALAASWRGVANCSLHEIEYRLRGRCFLFKFQNSEPDKMKTRTTLILLRSALQQMLRLGGALWLSGKFSAFGQGSLTPAGIPSPSMKTLQQVEPRTDLQNAPTSAVTT